MMKKKIGFSIIFICLIIAIGFGNLSNAAASPSLHLALQGSESNATITYGTEVNVTGWKETDEGVLSLLRDPALCHSGQGILTELYNCTGSVGWGKENPYESLNTVGHPNIAIGDINNDSINDIVVISDWLDMGPKPFRTEAYSMPSKTLAWQADLTGFAVIGDVNNDGNNEAVIATDYGYYSQESSLHVLKGDTGEELWNRSDLGVIKRTYSGSFIGAIAIGDVNNDSLNEVIVGSENGTFILNGTDGSMLWNYTEYPNIKNWIKLVDIDNNGIKEIVAPTWWEKDENTSRGGIFALSAVTKTKLWENIEEVDKDWYQKCLPSVLLSRPTVGYINSDGYKDLVASAWWNLKAFSLDNGTELWTSGGLGPAFCSHSGRPPDLMDVNDDGFNDVFASSDGVIFDCYNGKDGTLLKGYDIGHVHALDFDAEREIIVPGIDELALRLALINSTGDIVWNVDLGVEVYKEFKWPLSCTVLPLISGDYIFTFIQRGSGPPHDPYMALVNLSDGYIFRKYSFPITTSGVKAYKADLNEDGVEEFIVFDQDIYIVNKSILYDNEIYEPSQTLDPGVYNYTLNWYNTETGESESVTRTLTVLNETVKADPMLNLYLNGTSGNLTVTSDEVVNITATCSNTEGTLYLYKDGIEIQNVSGVISITNISSWNGSTGTVFNITAHYPETANYTASSNTWFIEIADAGDPPTIINWHNNVTNDSSTSITIIESAFIKFNVTADQPIDVWHWYKDGVDQSNNYDNFTTSWSESGTYKVNVSASNTNGTSDLVIWTIIVNDTTPPPVVVSIATDAGAVPGGTDTVPIVVDDGGDNMSLGSGIINVTYNPSVVNVTNVATGAGNALPVQSWTADNTAGWLIITSADGSEAHNGTVVFANVTYESMGSCGDSSPLNITVTSLRNWYLPYSQIPHTVSNGTFTIQDAAEPSVTNPSASRATILNDNDNGRPRVPGTNISQLNISVTDDAAVDTVTVDLSSIGGSAAEEMIKIPGTDIWTVTVNATAGVNLTHNLIVTATDTYGNSNNSVSIPLTVLRRGDIVRDNVVDDGDMLYIAKYVVGKEPAPDEFVAGVFPADSYDGVDDADMLYIAKYIVGKETAP